MGKGPSGECVKKKAKVGGGEIKKPKRKLRFHEGRNSQNVVKGGGKNTGGGRGTGEARSQKAILGVGGGRREGIETRYGSKGWGRGEERVYGGREGRGIRRGRP